MRSLALLAALIWLQSADSTPDRSTEKPHPAAADASTPAAQSSRGAFVVPEMTPQRTDVAPFEYVEVGPKIPNYPPSTRWGTQHPPHTKMQQPLPAEESIKHFVTPAGFEIRLFASEPDLGGKPIAMNWDERGRLWVCETVDYPNELQPPRQGRDRIRICEDTNHDGQADRFTVFAENLSIPTAILPIYGGALVQNGTETLFLEDTDGDDKADGREVLISNWTLGDTHGGVSNFQYGLDNWIWAMQGYNTSQPVIDGEQQQSFRMGFFRFKVSPKSSVESPEKSNEARNSGHSTLNTGLKVTALEFLRSTNNNTWGLGFSEEGLVFGSTANGNPSVYMPIPNRYYEQVRGWSPSALSSIADTYHFNPLSDKVRQVDWHGGYTAGAGHALYTARAFPQQWWNRTAFVCGPTGKLVGTFVLSPEGSDFRAASPVNLLASDDEWCAPIMAEVGPDGAVWVLDWYNYIVQHNPTPQGFEKGQGNAYVSDLRDKKHGRIYRVVYTGAPSVGRNSQPVPPANSSSQRADWEVRPAMSPASPEVLVETLRHPTMLWRKQAQRQLVERGETDVVPQLIELIEDQSVDEIGLNVGAIHALWTLHGLGALRDSDGPAANVVNSALSHPSAGVRRNAVQVLPLDRSAAMRIRKLTADPDSQVRLAAILRMAELPVDNESGPLVGALLQVPEFRDDRWIAEALTIAAAVHALPFLAHLDGSGPGSAHGPAPSEKELEAGRVVAEHVARGRPSREETERLIRILAAAHPAVAEAILSGLTGGWPQDHQVQIPTNVETLLLDALPSLPPAGKGQLIQLAGLWGTSVLDEHAEEIGTTMRQVISDAEASVDKRLAAARQLVGFRQQDASVVEELLELITPQTSPEFAIGMIDAVALSRADNLASQLIDRTPTMTPSSREAAVTALLGRPQTTGAVLEAIREGRLPMSDLSLEQKRLLTNHPDRRIRIQALRLISEGGGLPDPDRDKVLQTLIPLTRQPGDAVLGKALYVKHCAKCHQHASIDVASISEAQSIRDAATGNIGPNLTGMAVHPKAELLTHIIDPSRSVEGNFRMYTVLTETGQVMTGMLASETRTSIELIDTNAKRHSLAREDIEQLIASRKSVMPDGFEKQMSEHELSGLLSFLTDRGRYLPVDLRKAATIVSTKPMFHGQSPAERLIFEEWGLKTLGDVPYLLVDPQGGRQPNVILLNGPLGRFPPQMPRSVTLPVNATAGRIHLLSGIGGWCYPAHDEQSTSMIVRLHYEGGQTEDHELKNGIHFADYIRRIDVPGSEFAFDLGGRQVRYLTISPKQPQTTIQELEFVKGTDRTAPIVMAVTVEAPAE